MPEPDARSLASAWLAHAQADLRAARVLDAARDEADPFTACFHAQQAAEKALKAQLVALGLTVPYTHNLVALSARLPTGSAIQVATPDLALLSGYATEGRYAFDASTDHAPTWSDAEHAIEVASLVVSGVAAALTTSISKATPGEPLP